MKLYNGDCLEIMKEIPDGSVDLVLTDPPYNIGKAGWDKIENYVEWCGQWIRECQRVLKDNGTFIFWHNDIAQSAELLHWISNNTNYVLNSFCLWHKPNFRTIAWKNKANGCLLHSWFNIFEFFFVFVNPAAGSKWHKTGLEYIYDNPECFLPLKQWYNNELKRLGITKREIFSKYTEVTGKKPYMPSRHYFNDSQFEIPTKEVYESVYIPLGFNKSYEELRQSYEELRQSYEELRQSYEELRPTFNILEGETYSNYFIADKQNCSNNQLHPCMKPLDILEKIIKAHSNENQTVLDCFMGSGSTGEAAINLGRDFIGIEKEHKYFKTAEQRLKDALSKNKQLCFKS